MILVALSLLGVATVLFVLTPVFRPGTAAGLPSLDEAGHELRDLEEKKLRLYAAIKDLDFERAAGKVSSEDYDLARNDYLGQVAEVLARIDVLAPEREKKAQQAAKPDAKRKKSGGKGPKEDAGAAAAADTRSCSDCGAANPASAKFCVACGRALALACTSCGTALPEAAKFCLSCGTKVAP